MSDFDEHGPMSALAEPTERDVESTLRPRRMSEFVGQPRVREQLELVLRGALKRGQPPDHVLLSGPPGLGKTSLSMIIAAELGSAIRITSGPALERAGDLAAMLSNLVEGDVLFIDEIHRIARPADATATYYPIPRWQPRSGFHVDPALLYADTEVSLRMARHWNPIMMNAVLFGRIVQLYERRATLGLDGERLRLLERTYTRFHRAGAGLDEAAKARMA